MQTQEDSDNGAAESLNLATMVWLVAGGVVLVLLMLTTGWLAMTIS